ncbi:MAG: dihydroorotate dehydrogenase electron transfer subunit, partial [Peptococcaceae bacterium]|nr:dihydroorotate dehydrogenase electron transfer subunit [Peptococcaceae bacterium]
MPENAKVVVHEALGVASDLRRLVLECAAADTAQPGQFLHIRVSDGLDPLLRRPLSIAEIDPARRRLTVCYRVKGQGTQLLARAAVGQSLDVLGPLGRGFQLPQDGGLFLLAGGIGVFPLLALADAARLRGIPTVLFWGGEDRAFLENAGWRDLQCASCQIYAATLDGSLGEAGLVTDLLVRQWSGRPEPWRQASIAACGPFGM